MTRTWCVIARSPDNRQKFREVGIDQLGRPALMDPVIPPGGTQPPGHPLQRVRFADYDSALAFWCLVTFGCGVQGVDSVSSGVCAVVDGVLTNVPNDVPDDAADPQRVRSGRHPAGDGPDDTEDRAAHFARERALNAEAIARHEAKQ